MDDEVVQEIRRHFEVAAERLQEALANGYSNVERRLEEIQDELREEKKREFDETRALTRLSHSELERRIGALEQGRWRTVAFDRCLS